MALRVAVVWLGLWVRLGWVGIKFKVFILEPRWKGQQYLAHLLLTITGAKGQASLTDALAGVAQHVLWPTLVVTRGSQPSPARVSCVRGAVSMSNGAPAQSTAEAWGANPTAVEPESHQLFSSMPLGSSGRSGKYLSSVYVAYKMPGT